MATWSGSGSTLTAKVVSGDTLSQIALDASKKRDKTITYKNLASWNNISNPDRIYVDQVIKCYSPSEGGGGSSSSTKAPTNVAVITHFGRNSQDLNELIAEWTWAKETDTESYKIEWGYANGTGIWLGETLSEISVDIHNRSIARHATYSIPADATRVRFRVKPLAKKKKNSKGKETDLFTASWSAYKYLDEGAAPDAPPLKPLEVNGAKVKATVRYDEVNLKGVTHVQFKFQKNDDPKQTITPAKVALVGGVASYEHSGSNDSKYKCAARAYVKSRDVYSEWTTWTDNATTKPVAPSGITTLRANSPKEVYIAWGKVTTATKYEIQYTEDKQYFDTSDNVQKVEVFGDEGTTNPDPATTRLISVEAGKEYFFRVRAWNENISSHWTAIKSVVVGMKPSAPTTWSSTSKVIEADAKNAVLYWIHNSKDESRQTSAKLELRGLPDKPLNEPTVFELGTTKIDDNYILYTPTVVEKHEDEPTYECTLKSLNFKNGASIEWRICTAGVLNDDDGNPVYGPWSTPRTIDVYSTPGLTLSMPELNEGVLNSFPVFIHAMATPNDSIQWPTGYNVSITANTGYETTDPLGNFKMVNAGDEVYSRYANPTPELVTVYKEVGQLNSPPTDTEVMAGVTTYNGRSVYRYTDDGVKYCTVDDKTSIWYEVAVETSSERTVAIELLPSNITLENGMTYNVKCIASMSSGLTVEVNTDFTVDWTVAVCEPNAEIGVDKENLTASIRPYCETVDTEYRLVELVSGKYVLANSDPIDYTYGEVVMVGSGKNKRAATLETGEPVYSGEDDNGNAILFAVIENRTLVEDVWLSVYRREFDGRFTEIATNLDAASRTTVTDPHPALDYARYRIVAADKTTGHIEYFDCPAYPVGGIAAVLQWDEQATNFDALEDVAPVDPALSGSMLKLPYNIDVSDSTKPDYKLVEYIGRSHPVSYYGTHLGSSSSWSMVIDKNDVETIYALRRLQRWLGDVYVREPSGTGYWAQVTVSFSQNHCEVTIPVSLSITRVEGGA